MSTTTDLATRNGTVAAHQPGALAIQDGQPEWTPMQLAALGQLGVKDAPDGDKQVFLHVSQRTGLDPFARQIYMIPRNEKKSERRNGQWVDTWTTKWTIQTGIEGWRVIRDRAERRYGLRGIKGRFTYYDADGNDYPAWVRPLPPVAVELTYTVIEPGGREVPYTSILRYSEYVQLKDGKPVAQWATKPVHMLEKCTEADAYRCAFPQDYSGVVLDDTMPPPEPATEVPQRATGEEIRNRPRRPQQVRSEVVTVTPDAAPEDAPWPGDAVPARPARNADRATGEVIPDGDADPTTSGASSSAHAPGSASQRRTGRQSPSTSSGSGTIPDQDADPRAAVLAAFDALGVAGPEIPAYLTRWSGHKYASPESLSRAAATWFSGKLAGLGSRDELEAVVVAAEARREQDAEGEAAGE
jgi:phage recombination protein Bet